MSKFTLRSVYLCDWNQITTCSRDPVYPIVGCSEQDHTITVPGASKSQASLIGAIMGQDPPPMTPKFLDQVVKRCLAKEPDERWQSAGDLMAGLKWVRDGAGAGTVSEKSVHEQPRKGLAWSLVVVLVFLLVGVLAVWYSDTTTVENWFSEVQERMKASN